MVLASYIKTENYNKWQWQVLMLTIYREIKLIEDIWHVGSVFLLIFIKQSSPIFYIFYYVQGHGLFSLVWDWDHIPDCSNFALHWKTRPATAGHWRSHQGECFTIVCVSLSVDVGCCCCSISKMRCPSNLSLIQMPFSTWPSSWKSTRRKWRDWKRWISLKLENICCPT